MCTINDVPVQGITRLSANDVWDRLRPHYPELD